MKRYYKLVTIIFALFCLLTGCFSNTSDNASPKAVLKNDPKADFFIMESTVYKNAASIDWVKELSLNADILLGTIKNTGVKNNFNDWDATILDIGTEIYKVENRNDLVLVKVGERYLPYLRYVEG